VTQYIERIRVVDEARTWIGTPFHHAQALRGVGVDCAHLLVAVYSAAGLVHPPMITHYAADWFLHERAERLLEILADHCVPVIGRPGPGDIAVFRFGRAISHAAIVQDFPHIIHAERTVGRVVEDRCAPNDAITSRWAGAWTLKRWAEMANV
jgi:cell wall-associated NlpC family hydrolase